MSNWIFGIVGTILCFWLGTQYFGLSVQDILLSIAVSNLAGFVALLTTLTLERQPAIKRILMNRSMKTWLVLTTLYLVILLGLVPALRVPMILAGMFLPLIFCTGFMIPLFGLAQDQVYRRDQRRAKGH